MSGGSGLPSGAQMRAEVDAGLAAMQSVAQSAAEQMVRGLANGVSYIALEEWTMQGAVESAIDLLRDRMDPNMADLDQAIPQWVFQRAKGVAFMWVYKVGMFASVSAGSGIVLAKFKGLDGRTRWSAPSAFAFGGGGGGFDFGGARSDVLLILNSDESVSMFTGTNMKLSMAVQAALGPLGRHAEGGLHLDPERTELETNYSYGSSAGLFVGVGLQGLVVVPRDKENQEYYRADAISAVDLLAGAAGLDVLGRHEEVGRLHRMLDKACGGNGRPERYDTPEMRGTPF